MHSVVVVISHVNVGPRGKALGALYSREKGAVESFPASLSRDSFIRLPNKTKTLTPNVLLPYAPTHPGHGCGRDPEARTTGTGRSGSCSHVPVSVA
jgi:hypothetical protein